MKILVTAFEPFGGETENPTTRVLSQLRDVDTLVLPVSFVDAPRIALRRIRETGPEAVILLGQAGGRAAISLERVAINLADAKSADNRGDRPQEAVIVESGPAAYFSKLPLAELRDLIREKGIPCHLSNSAGTYVCNTLYYSVMNEIPDLPVVFVHVPYSPRQAVDKKSSTPSMSVADMAVAVETIAAWFETLSSYAR